MGQLDGKIAIVTGGGKGLGEAVATAYTAEGATVVVTDIDGESAERVASGLDRATAMTVDAADEGQVSGMVDQVVADHGGLDIMVANAGIGLVKPVVECDLADWRTVTRINLDGVFLADRYAAPAMIASGGGTIVNMASITALAGSALVASYAAAKAGVVSLTQTLAVELRDHGVRVNCIAPGFIGTDLVDDNKPLFEQYLDLPVSFDELIASKQGRYGVPEEVAALAVFLASDRSRFSSGGVYVLDGGARASML